MPPGAMYGVPPQRTWTVMVRVSVTVLVSAGGDSVKGTLLTVAMLLRYIVSVSVVLTTYPWLLVAVRAKGRSLALEERGAGMGNCLRVTRFESVECTVCCLIGRCGIGCPFVDRRVSASMSMVSIQLKFQFQLIVTCSRM